MRASRIGLFFLASAAWAAAQAVQPGAFTRAEEGLDAAVRWKWEVRPSADPGWALVRQEPVPAAPAPGDAATEADSYIVKRGDALAKIARRHKITVDQLKRANGLEKDLIIAGQELRIPSAEEIALMPAPAPAVASKTSAPQPGQPPAAGYDPDILLLQIHLDRMNFSPGPIDGQSGLRFQKLMFTAQSSIEGAGDFAALIEKARSETRDLFTTYTLRPQDFRFIDANRPSPARTKVKKTPAERDGEAYRQMTSSPELLYRSPWEFVAERFHCDEQFLHRLNPTLKFHPEAGTTFCVPNVHPFEIEHSLEQPLQPPADDNISIKAIIADLSQLEIYRNDRLVAVFPVAIARPGLRGRGEWRILDVMPRPHLETLRELRVAPRPHSLPQEDAPKEEPATLAEPEILGPGPRNPLGILWINLAKSDAPETPLPFGLHGTSIPDHMATRESLGGFRLTNWDIIRAVRLLPQGTSLRWRQTISKPVPAAAPADPPSQPVPAALPALPTEHPPQSNGNAIRQSPDLNHSLLQRKTISSARLAQR